VPADVGGITLWQGVRRTIVRIADLLAIFGKKGDSPMKRQMLMVLILFANMHVCATWAQIPEPDAILYGIVRIDGIPRAAGDDVSVIARAAGVEEAVCAYHLGDDENAGDSYVLRIRLESLTDGTGKIVFQDTDILIDQSVAIYVASEGLEVLAGTFTIGGRGIAQRFDLDVLTSPDSDGDGVVDQREIAWGLNPNETDTDGDGLSDMDEVCYDGDCASYSPYDPATGTGTDLNAAKVDTDSDGMPDHWETVGRLNPLIDDSNADNDNDGFTNLQEFLAGSLPDDDSSIPVIYVDASAIGADDGSSWTDAYNDLQNALLAATSGYEIWVATGTYKPHQGSDRTVSFQLKSGVALYGGFPTGGAIWQRRNPDMYETVLSGNVGAPGTDADNSYHVVTGSGTDETSIIDGFTITGGFANGADPYEKGGGMYNDNGGPTLIRCVFRGNSAENYGGGMFNEASSPGLINCTFSGNSVTSAESLGGGIFNDGSYPALLNCTLTSNEAGLLGGAMHNSRSSEATVTDCILWNNSPQEIADDESSISLVSYSDVAGGWPGDGNIDAEPCFADPVSGDYRLKSQVGRWDAVTQSWVYDDVTSLCIDAGDPASDWTYELWPHGRRVNMGAYGGTPQASMSLSDVGNIADLNNDDIVDLADLAYLADSWQTEDLLLAEDCDRSGSVDFHDVDILAENWLRGVAP